ncbi:MAG: SMC-Scp complex subunit ScpB [Pseudomonadota bacterium]
MSIEKQQLTRIIEGALFAADMPLSIDKLIALFEPKQAPNKQTIREVLLELQQQYHQHGIELKETASGWKFQVCQDLAPWIKQLWKMPAPRYSRALMETLALIAYKQPITRAEIEDIRGVAVSSQIIRTLEDHGWIRQAGHRDTPGRPALLVTTKQFLDHFGMKSLKELPALNELTDLDAMTEDLQKQLNLEEPTLSQGDDDTAISDAESEGLPLPASNQETNSPQVNDEDTVITDAESEGMPTHEYDKNN